MLDEKRFIGIDLGAESGRCIVARLADNQLSLDEIHRFETYNYFKNGEFHWNIEKIFEEIISGLKIIAERYGSNFESIGIDTWGVDYAIIDSNQNLLNDPFHYRDDRTDNVMDNLFNIISKESLYEITGIQTLQFNTIFQLFSEYSNKNSNIKSAEKVLLIPDYLNYLLCKKKNAEYTIASTTGLTDPFTRNWNWEIIEKLNFDRSIFPPISEPGSIVGTLTEEISDKTKLESFLPIVATAEHDTASAVVAAPSRVDNWAFLSSGTWSIMGIESKSPVINASGMNLNFSNEGGINGTTRLCRNIIGMWPIQECRRSWNENSQNYDYSSLTQLAKEIGYVSTWVDLSDLRFLKAGDMPEKVFSFLKASEQKTSSEIGFIVRVLLESLAFTYKTLLMELEKVIGYKIEELNIIGGGTQNELLCQLTADALNINVVAGPIEGTIIGNFGVQAISNKTVKDLESWRKIVANSFELKNYSPQNADYFDQNYDKYLNIKNL